MSQLYRAAVMSLPHDALGEVVRLGLNDPSVLPLWLGESDLPTPAVIRNACTQALADGHTRYAHAGGLPRLREAIGAYMSRIYETEVSADRITVPGSAMLSVHLLMQTLLKEGDHIAIVTPQWPNILLSAHSHGATVDCVPQDLDTTGPVPRWRLDLDRLFDACGPKTKAIFVGSPANPTGWTATADEQAAILNFARSRGLALIGDDVYTRLVYEGEHAPSFVSLAEPDEPVFIINSFSKLWAMTGWRLGWITAPRSLASTFTSLSAIANTGAPTFTQYGAIAALEEGEDFVTQMRTLCREGLAAIEEHLGGQNRIRMARPGGAFYAFLEIDGLSDSVAFAKAALQAEKVGVAPGRAFGPGNDGRIRLCFAQRRATLDEGLDRLTRFIAAGTWENGT